MDAKKIITILIIVINLLSLVIYLHSLNLSCDKCNLKLTMTSISGHKLEEPIVKEVPILELYNKSREVNCPIRWSRTDGFIEN